MPLRQLYPDPKGTETHASPTVIDIIAVPGLGPPVKGEVKHAFDTWRTPSDQKGRLWLQHDLPNHIPDSRIFLYQYYTTATYCQGLDDFRSKADNLLEAINIERRDCSDRPILLLGHSMGGLLIKQALINAHSNAGYSAIKDDTTGIVFFATPHEFLTQKLGEIGTAIAIELGHGIQDDLARTLQAGSIFSELESWKHQALQYDTVSFWGSSDTIVTRNNVSLGLPVDVAKIVELDANHRGICKFSNSKKDQYNFKIVVENIKRLCELAIENTKSQETDGQTERHDMLEEIQRVALSMSNETEQLIMTPSQESQLQDDEVVVQESLKSTAGHSTTKDVPVLASSTVQDLHIADVLAVESQNKLYSQMPFELLILQEPILQGIRYLNYQKPTIVQEAVLSALTLCPPRNVIASYSPGTGRTTALAIALLSRIDYHSATQPQALVMVATQFLVRQTENYIKEVGRFCEGLVVKTITASSRPTAMLEANVIIATPGTLLNCILRRLVDMSQVRYLLMDDVDHVVDLQGLSQECLRVAAVARKSPETVQLLLFSDTSTRASEFLNVMLMSNTLERHELKGVELNANKIAHLVFRCSAEEQKLEIICKLPGVVTTSVLIIFVQTKASASHIHLALAAEGHAVANLFEADYSDDMEALLKRFHSGEFKVLITKDYKTRGLDLLSSSMVINYDIPDADACRYLRQVSRAGKAGRSGFAVNLVSNDKEFESLQSVATSQCLNLHELRSNDWDAVERYWLSTDFMGGSDEEKEEEKERKRDIVGDFLYASFIRQQHLDLLRDPSPLDPSPSADVFSYRKKNLNKGEIALKHAVGLGSQPNVVPVTEPVVDGPRRPVEVGWHPVGGFAGKWFAEETGLGKMITEKINKYPDPTQHWAVLVGDYAHQLWMDENFDVIYTNAKIERDEWRTFPVGETRFNDDALRRAGESVIQSIRERQPTYNLITNNCQTYVLQLLDAIKVGVNKEFGTTLAVYERVFGPGKIKDLFEGEEKPEDQQQHQIEQGGEPGVEPGTQQPIMHPGRSDTVNLAQDVMNQNTNQLDTEREMERHEDEKEVKEKKKKGFFSRFKRSNS
ncbi:uncharacterized protein FSUBG_12303 [Fusarium subglutinans]|uniref:ATP-dependent RNA helicase n=1 Tax=Gibberella subglutinans TaxID=42677 RepID=A0A8H5L6X0_GIBSU|nr:uncharacterized protein FSUBG_12303 [Fusarium subglutinans]KAF5585844.1 hypothetical protein FSUBG_12303 [Fusarium subglutinans]